MITGETVETVDVGAPIGPGEAEESAFLAEQGEVRSPKAVSPSGVGAESDANTPFPPMDDLIHRIPAASRELMDQLFRAKFITVKRMPASAFKTQN